MCLYTPRMPRLTRGAQCGNPLLALFSFCAGILPAADLPPTPQPLVAAPAVQPAVAVSEGPQAPAVESTPGAQAATEVERWMDDLDSPTVEKREQAIKALQAAVEIDRPALLKRFVNTPSLTIRKTLEELLHRNRLLPREDLGELLKHPLMTAAAKALQQQLKADRPAEKANAELRRFPVTLVVLLREQAGQETNVDRKVQLLNLYYEQLRDSTRLAAQIADFADLLAITDPNDKRMGARGNAKLFYTLFIAKKPYGLQGLDEMQNRNAAILPYVDQPAAVELYQMSVAMFNRLVEAEKDPAALQSLKSARDAVQAKHLAHTEAPQANGKVFD